MSTSCEAGKYYLHFTEGRIQAEKFSELTLAVEQISLRTEFKTQVFLDARPVTIPVCMPGNLISMHQYVQNSLSCPHYRYLLPVLHSLMSVEVLLIEQAQNMEQKFAWLMRSNSKILSKEKRLN